LAEPCGLKLVVSTGRDRRRQKRIFMGKGCILWAVGVPIPIIILLYVFNIL
jgi:hypothetical protein